LHKSTDFENLEQENHTLMARVKELEVSSRQLTEQLNQKITEVQRLSDDAQCSRQTIEQLQRDVKQLQKDKGDLEHALDAYKNPVQSGILPELKQLVDTYNKDQKSLLNLATEVTRLKETEKSVNSRQEGHSQEITLVTATKDAKLMVVRAKSSNVKGFLLFPAYSRMDSIQSRTAKALFDFHGYQGGEQKFVLKMPARVSPIDDSNQQWRLDQKGELEFT
jgi:DNA repair exonuclease SbcCD ATPase subunit